MQGDQQETNNRYKVDYSNLSDVERKYGESEKGRSQLQAKLEELAKQNQKATSDIKNEAHRLEYGFDNPGK